jgi:hypothetical protein
VSPAQETGIKEMGVFTQLTLKIAQPQSHQAVTPRQTTDLTLDAKPHRNNNARCPRHDAGGNNS